MTLDRPMIPIRDPQITIVVHHHHYYDPPLACPAPPAPPQRPIRLLGKILAAPFVLLAIAWALGSIG